MRMACLRNFLAFKNSKGIEMLSSVVKAIAGLLNILTGKKKGSLLEGIVFDRLTKWHLWGMSPSFGLLGYRLHVVFL